MADHPRRAARGILLGLVLSGGMAYPWTAVAGEDSAFLGPRFPYDAFRRLTTTRIAVGGGTLEVAFAPGDLELGPEAIVDWVRRGVLAVVHFYGQLPTHVALVLIVPSGGSGVQTGSSYGFREAASRVVIGRETTREQLEHDWILVHELVHHGFPSVADEHHWMEEGLATYVEPIARAQLGDLPARRVWSDLVDGLPKGLPLPGDRGLDHTPTWGRTYWGGALFYLMADLRIRERTDNRRGLQDALRAIVASGGNITQDWPVEKVLETGDRATGTGVLHELYDEMGSKPASVDLDALWRRLGVSVRNGNVRFDDSAPLASIRRAITACPSLEAGDRVVAR